MVTAYVKAMGMHSCVRCTLASTKAKNDIIVLHADHGNTCFKGTDHTHELWPLVLRKFTCNNLASNTLQTWPDDLETSLAGRIRQESV